MSFVTLRLVGDDAKIGWEKAGAHLYPAIDSMAGLYEYEDIRERVIDPESGWHLWLIAEGTEPLGAWTTQIKFYPRGRCMDIPFAGGKRMLEWYDKALADTEQYGREWGCDRLRCCGRRGWEKFGYRPKGWLFERRIT